MRTVLEGDTLLENVCDPMDQWTKDDKKKVNIYVRVRVTICNARSYEVYRMVKIVILLRRWLTR